MKVNKSGDENAKGNLMVAIHALAMTRKLYLVNSSIVVSFLYLSVF